MVRALCNLPPLMTAMLHLPGNFFALAALLAALFCAPLAARAQSADAAIAKMASGDFADLESGITELAASGSSKASAIFEALTAGRLFIRADAKGLVIKDAADKASDAATGEPVTDAGGLDPVRLNNRVRRALEAAAGSMTLVSADPAKRLAAAQSVFKSKDPNALAAVEEAIGKETDPKIKAAFEEARAAIFLTSGKGSESDKIAAAQAMQKKGDQDALGLLRQAAAGGAPSLKAIAATGIAAIERRQAVTSAFQNAWYGLSLGSVLLLAAIGLAITFGVMGIINMAHGEMVMIGAYTTFVIQEIFRSRAPELFGWSLPIAIPAAFLTAGLVGVLIERSIIRFLYGRPLETLLATWGVSLILQQAVRSIFGPTNLQVGSPSYMSGSFEILGLAVTYGRLWIILFSLAVFAFLLFVLRATSFGLKIRAVTQNRRMAAAMGIRTPLVDTMAFGLGSGNAGIAGVALSQIDNVSPNLGQSYIVDSFMVVVFGGVGSLWGTLVAALTLGVANKFLEPYAGAVLGKILLLVFIILFIQKRPRGLFALKGRAVEA